jgi:hypothetical protein
MPFDYLLLSGCLLAGKTSHKEDPFLPGLVITPEQIFQQAGIP